VYVPETSTVVTFSPLIVRSARFAFAFESDPSGCCTWLI